MHIHIYIYIYIHMCMYIYTIFRNSVSTLRGFSVKSKRGQLGAPAADRELFRGLLILDANRAFVRGTGVGALAVFEIAIADCGLLGSQNFAFGLLVLRNAKLLSLLDVWAREIRNGRRTWTCGLTKCGTVVTFGCELRKAKLSSSLDVSACQMRNCHRYWSSCDVVPSVPT